MSTAFITRSGEIRSRFQTLVSDVLTLPVEYDNVSQPTLTDAPWVRFTLQPSVSQQVEMKTFRYPGVAIAQVFVPLADGDGPIYTITDLICSVFRAQTIGTIVYETPFLTQVGRDGKWWQVNVTCPYFFDEII